MNPDPGPHDVKVGLSPFRLVAVGLTAALGMAFAWALVTTPREGVAAASADPGALQLPSHPLFDDVPPVVLLCIDGEEQAILDELRSLGNIE